MLRSICLITSCIFAVLGACLTAPSASAQSPDQPDPTVLLLMDSSKSMSEDAGNGQTRMEASQAAVGDVVGALPPQAPVGLRVGASGSVGRAHHQR